VRVGPSSDGGAYGTVTTYQLALDHHH
jgi:hypothetical protein